MILVQLSSISCCWDCMIIPWAGLENVWQGQERESSFENCDNASLSDLPCKMFLNACTAFYEAPVLHCKGVCQCHAAGGEYALGWRRWTPINPSTPKVFHVKFSQRKTGPWREVHNFLLIIKWPYQKGGSRSQLLKTLLKCVSPILECDINLSFDNFLILDKCVLCFITSSGM